MSGIGFIEVHRVSDNKEILINVAYITDVLSEIPFAYDNINATLIETLDNQVWRVIETYDEIKELISQSNRIFKME